MTGSLKVVLLVVGACAVTLFITSLKNKNGADARRAIPSTPTPAVSAQPSLPLKSLSPAEKGAVAKAQKTAHAEAEKNEETVRIAYAKLIENNLLRNNMNVDVYSHGPKHSQLTMKWVLASKSLVFRFSEEQQDTLQQMKQVGFKKFTITDGYDQSWSWNLAK